MVQPKGTTLDVLELVVKLTDTRDYGVAVRDISSHLGFAESTAYYHLQALQAAGLITRTPYTARSIYPTAEGRQMIEEVAA